MLIFIKETYLFVRNLYGLIVHPFKTTGEIVKKPDHSQTILIFGLPFYLFFQGLTLSSAATGALIHKTLIFWVALWAIPILKEKINTKQWLALGLIFGSNFIIGGLPRLAWGIGEWMILGATLLWSIENIIAKNVLR